MAHEKIFVGLEDCQRALTEIMSTQFITIGNNKYFVLSGEIGVLDEHDHSAIPTLTITYDVNDVIYA